VAEIRQKIIAGEKRDRDFAPDLHDWISRTFELDYSRTLASRLFSATPYPENLPDAGRFACARDRLMAEPRQSSLCGPVEGVETLHACDSR
jgi:hypothetical protein